MNADKIKNHGDLFRALLTGQRLRHRSWREAAFVYFYNGDVLNEDGTAAIMGFAYPHEWSIYEPKKLAKAWPVVYREGSRHKMSTVLFTEAEFITENPFNLGKGARLATELAPVMVEQL